MILKDGFILQRIIKLCFRHYHIIGVVSNLIVIMLNVIQVTLRMRCFRLADIVLIAPENLIVFLLIIAIALIGLISKRGQR